MAGGDPGPVSESDVAYAGIDAAATSAVTTELVDAVIAGAPADAGPTDAAVSDAMQVAVDGAASAQDWAGWNAATAGWSRALLPPPGYVMPRFSGTVTQGLTQRAGAGWHLRLVRM